MSKILDSSSRHESGNPYPSSRLTFSHLKDRMTGQWRPCLEALGIPQEAFKRGGQPCIFCGGSDRANFGNHQHPETYYCRQCKPQGCDGFTLLQEWHRWSAKEALQAVAGWLGMGYHDNIIPFTRPRTRPLQAPKPQVLTDRRDRVQQVWKEAAPLMSKDASIARVYFDARGLIDLPTLPRDMRLHPSLAYWWRNPDGDPVKLGEYPALVSLIRSVDGRVKGLHRTYLSRDGSRKLYLTEDGLRQLPAKKTIAIHDGATAGCSVQLLPVSAAGLLAVSEGVETALAVTTLWDVPCWSCLSAGNMERFELPPGVTELLICTDCDESGTGQYAGKVLARRVLAMTDAPDVRLLTPTEIGSDWLDCLRRDTLEEEVRHGQA